MGGVQTTEHTTLSVVAKSQMKAAEYGNKSTNTRAVRKVSVHFKYLDNRSRGLYVTWQPVRGDLIVHP
jgi:hypothetical protein